MWHIDVSIMSDDSLSWGISKGHIGEEKECVRLSFLIRSSSRKYKKREVVNTFKQIIIVKNNISWISLINEKWILNIDEMKEFFQKLPQLNWLKGKIFIKPEFEIGEEDETFGLYKKYETEIVFYITPDEIKSSYEQQKVESKADIYVAEERIEEFRSLKNPKYDIVKLVKLCEELNKCYRNKCELAIAALVRTILNHVPPIFEKESFEKVANNYSWGKGKRKGESKKGLMIDLEESARKIADIHLHQEIRETESLPTMTQVDFINKLDVLLEEIVRILKA